MPKANTAKKMKRKMKKKAKKAERKGVIQWALGQEDLTRNPIYRSVRNRVDRIAQHGPIGIFKGKGKGMGDMRNAHLRGGKGKISSVAGSSSNSRPYITTISERMERVNTVNSSVTFNNQIQCALNPGLQTCFPWLSTVAANYELYSFKKLWFEYRTTSGEVMSGSNPALGKVIMATNYDVIQPPFPGIIDMENYEGNANFPPYQTVARHTVDVNGRSMAAVLPYTRRYIRSGPVPDTTAEGGAGDPHAYDVGLFQVGTQGMPADDNQVGELWVGYSIDLIKPRPAVVPVYGDGYSVRGLSTYDVLTATFRPFLQEVPAVPTDPVVADNPGLDISFTNDGVKTLFSISNPLARSFLITAWLDAGSNILGENIIILPEDGMILNPGAPGFTPNAAARNNGFATTTIALTAQEGYSTCVFSVQAPTSTPDSPATYSCSLIALVVNIPGPELTYKVFKPRHLVRKEELEDLRTQFLNLKSYLEEKEEKSDYSVISTLSQQRNVSPVRSSIFGGPKK